MEKIKDCPRCGIGLDTDGDGDCWYCHGMNNLMVAYLRRLKDENQFFMREHQNLQAQLKAEKDKHASFLEGFKLGRQSAREETV